MTTKRLLRACGLAAIGAVICSSGEAAEEAAPAPGPSPPPAMVTFHKGYSSKLGVYGQSPYKVLPGRECKKPFWKGTFLWATGSSRTGPAPSGSPVMVATELTFSHGNTDSTCFGTAIFTPLAGHNYDVTLKGELAKDTCDLVVLDRDLGAPPPDVDISHKTNCENHGNPSPDGKPPTNRPGWVW